MLPIRNLLRAKLRSVLTLLGIGVGIALFVSVATMSTDLIQQVNRIVGSYNTEVMVLDRKARSPLHSRLNETQISSLDNLVEHEVTPVILGRIRVPTLRKISLLGIHERLHTHFPVINGRTVKPQANEIMIGVIASNLLQLKPGATLTLNSVEYQITGTFRTGSKSLDSGLATHADIARKIMGTTMAAHDYSFALVLTGDSSESQHVIATINEAMPQFKAIGSLDFSGLHQTLRSIEIFAWSVAGIALIGAALVLANTLFMSVLERSREIGIMMTIGWRPWYILRTLWLESLVLCLTGVALGNLIALWLLHVLSSTDAVTSNYSVPDALSPMVVMFSFLLAPLLSLLGMFYPAVAVFRMQPIQIIRHE